MMLPNKSSSLRHSVSKQLEQETLLLEGQLSMLRKMQQQRRESQQKVAKSRWASGGTEAPIAKGYVSEVLGQPARQSREKVKNRITCPGEQDKSRQKVEKKQPFVPPEDVRLLASQLPADSINMRTVELKLLQEAAEIERELAPESCKHHTWATSSEVERFLKEAGLDQYHDAFLAHGYDSMDRICGISERDIHTKLGFNLENQMKLIKKIREYKRFRKVALLTPETEATSSSSCGAMLSHPSSGAGVSMRNSLPKNSAARSPDRSVSDSSVARMSLPDRNAHEDQKSPKRRTKNHGSPCQWSALVGDRWEVNGSLTELRESSMLAQRTTPSLISSETLCDTPSEPAVADAACSTVSMLAEKHRKVKVCCYSCYKLFFKPASEAETADVVAPAKEFCSDECSAAYARQVLERGRLREKLIQEKKKLLESTEKCDRPRVTLLLQTSE